MWGMKAKRQRKRRLTRRSTQEREALIKKYMCSGQSKSAFCRQHGINLKTFCQWVGPTRAVEPVDRKGVQVEGLGSHWPKSKAGGKARDAEGSFTELKVCLPSGAAVEVLFTSGLRMHVNDLRGLEAVTDLIKSLEGTTVQPSEGPRGC